MSRLHVVVNLSTSVATVETHDVGSANVEITFEDADRAAKVLVTPREARTLGAALLAASHAAP